MASITNAISKSSSAGKRKFRGHWRAKHGRGGTRGKVHTTGQQMNQFKKNKGRISKQNRFSRPFERKRQVVRCQTLKAQCSSQYSDEEIIPFPVTSLEEQVVPTLKEFRFPQGAMMQVWRHQPEKGTTVVLEKTLRQREICWQGCRPQIHEKLSMQDQ
jgi:hypothetical protein